MLGKPRGLIDIYHRPLGLPSIYYPKVRKITGVKQKLSPGGLKIEEF